MGRKMKGGAGANDQICHQIGELRDKNIFNIFRPIIGNIIINLTRLHQIVNHIQQIEIRQYIIPNPIEVNRTLRVHFLMNNVSEDHFKKTITIREKNTNKMIDFNNIYQMFVNVCSDIFLGINTHYRKNKGIEFITEQYQILNNLIGYFNENMKKNGKKYTCVYPGITTNFTFVRNLDKQLKSERAIELQRAAQT